MTAPAAAHPTPAARPVTPAVLWFGLFGAPAVWSLQLLASYALVAHGCYPDAAPMAVPVVPGLRGLLLGASAAALVVGVLAGALAWRAWLRTRHEHDGWHEGLLEVGEGRTRFMALSGMLLSVVFVLGIVMDAVPVLMLRPCS